MTSRPQSSWALQISILSSGGGSIMVQVSHIVVLVAKLSLFGL
jgi:hypothetical protein